jgi:hypothetical protein
VVGVLSGELACSLEVLRIEAGPVGERTAEATTGDVEGKYHVKRHLGSGRVRVGELVGRHDEVALVVDDGRDVDVFAGHSHSRQCTS